MVLRTNAVPGANDTICGTLARPHEMKADLLVPLDLNEADLFDDTPIALFAFPITLKALPMILGLLKIGGFESRVLLDTPEEVALTGIVLGIGGITSDPVNSILTKGFPAGAGGGAWPGGCPPSELRSSFFKWELKAVCIWIRVWDGAALGESLGSLGGERGT